ncbi:MAG: RDD family protein [Betaproteobacteria bacterium]|nr:MAG: RDD family protein [Betaproteobacteria bacterium]
MASYGDSRYAPPSASVADIAAPQGLVLASRWRRFFGVFIDSLALYLLMALSAPLVRLTVWHDFNIFSPLGIFAFNRAALPGAVLFLLLNGYLLVARGQTVGKVALDMRIVRPDGSKVSGARVLGLRYGVGYAANVVPVLGGLYGFADCLMIFRMSRRCLHDEIADTIVVRT